jgi:hypothetical protein
MQNEKHGKRSASGDVYPVVLRTSHDPNISVLKHPSIEYFKKGRTASGKDDTVSRNVRTAANDNV